VVVDRRSVRVHEPSEVRRSGVHLPEAHLPEAHLHEAHLHEAQHREVHRFLGLTNEVRRRGGR
jgi:hypothetical protein